MFRPGVLLLWTLLMVLWCSLVYVHYVKMTSEDKMTKLSSWQENTEEERKRTKRNSNEDMLTGNILKLDDLTGMYVTDQNDTDTSALPVTTVQELSLSYDTANNTNQILPEEIISQKSSYLTRNYTTKEQITTTVHIRNEDKMDKNLPSTKSSEIPYSKISSTPLQLKTETSVNVDKEISQIDNDNTKPMESRINQGTTGTHFTNSTEKSLNGENYAATKKYTDFNVAKNNKNEQPNIITQISAIQQNFTSKMNEINNTIQETNTGTADNQTETSRKNEDQSEINIAFNVKQNDVSENNITFTVTDPVHTPPVHEDMNDKENSTKFHEIVSLIITKETTNFNKLDSPQTQGYGFVNENVLEQFSTNSNAKNNETIDANTTSQGGELDIIDAYNLEKRNLELHEYKSLLEKLYKIRAICMVEAINQINTLINTFKDSYKEHKQYSSETTSTETSMIDIKLMNNTKIKNM